MARRYLLSIDGGGLRGIIPLCMLAELERQTGRPTRETFSFVAGTSTGAIITAGIAAGVPAARMLDLYMGRASYLFPSSPLNLPRRVLFGWMYETQRLHELIVEQMGPARGWRLNDAPIDLLITAKRVVDGMPWYFVRDNPRNSGRTGGLELASCATASAAAPTYFRPWVVAEDAASQPPDRQPVGRLVDGGVGVAGNPVYQACVEAFYYAEGYDPAETTVVSLGTGRFLGRSNPTWLWAWFQWVLSETLRSPGEQQTELVRRHFPDLRFYRLDLELARDLPLDDSGAVDELRLIGEKFAASVDWAATLASADNAFLVRPQTTLFPQYARRVS